LLASQKKLEADEEAAEEALFALQQQLSTAVNRLTRIRRIRKKVEERGSELLRRGLQELDAEDGTVPCPLEAQESFVTGELRNLGVPEDVDWGSLGLGNDESTFAWLSAPDSAGDTGQAPAGNASGA
jgi:hypothetical protein